MSTPEPYDEIMTPAEVAAALKVDPKTVSRWAKSGKLESIRTPGGHRRYKASQVRGFLGFVNELEQRESR